MRGHYGTSWVGQATNQSINPLPARADPTAQSPAKRTYPWWSYAITAGLIGLFVVYPVKLISDATRD